MNDKGLTLVCSVVGFVSFLKRRRQYVSKWTGILKLLQTGKYDISFGWFRQEVMKFLFSTKEEKIYNFPIPFVIAYVHMQSQIKY